jgi:hypothetical protein
MPAKTIQQQPVDLTHVQAVSYVVHPTGGIDYSYSYTPEDETGAPVGEKRVLSGTKSGAAAIEIRTWITNEVLPEVNEHEGTA